jgi:hypothetical protein
MLSLTAAVMFAPIAAIAADADKEPPVTPEKLQFDQKRAAAHMLEMEDRMYQLAELLREVEPENAARLLLALKQSRETLVVDQMKLIEQLLEAKQLKAAAEGESEALAKLDDIRQLLLSIDLDFQLKMARLRLMRKTLDRLNKTIEDEQHEQEQTDKLAERQKKDDKISDKAFPYRKQEQARTSREAEAVRHMMKQLQSSGAAALPKMDRALNSMSSAEASLSQSQGQQASGEQQEAVESMQSARDELEREMQQLLEDLQKQVKNRFMAALSDMLEQQKAVRETTEKLGPRATEGIEAAVNGVKRLGPREGDIADTADAQRRMIEETEFSIALPLVLTGLHGDMTKTAGNLTEGNGSTDVIADERAIEATLEDLLAAMKQSQKGEPSPPGQACKSCGGKNERNQLAAELKILRMVQKRILVDTRKMEAKRLEDKDGNSRGRYGAAIGALETRQEKLQQAMKKQHAAVCRQCEGH